MCKLCEIKPVYEFTNQRKLCARCFINYFQKKVLYIIRKFKMIQNNDDVVYENKGDFRGVVLEDVLKMFAEKAFISLHRNPPTTLKKKSAKIALSSTIDTESNKLVHNLIKGNAKNLKELGPVVSKIIKPLYLFLDEEVLLYAKLKKLKYKKKIEKKDKISNFINDLEVKHPEIKHAIINSYLEIFK